MQPFSAKSGPATSHSPGTIRAGEPTSEDLLVAVGQARSRDAFIRLFEHYAPRVKSFLIKGGTPPDLADELAQETMLTVWHRAAQYDPAKSGAGTWIYTIARNKRIDAARRKAARGGAAHNVPVDELFFLPDADTPTPDQAIAEAQETHIVSAAMATLPPEQAEILYKSFFENKTHSEIAEETHLPLGTVKSRIRLALERLRAKIGPEMAP
ncbi:MAG: sigma-70 family RNA polymerase sigma factor [Alphaproteobacteria bacterium]|nr:sigma-70 family RNA polymerase sigma factor [Alphaproteobacteria bacterium]MBU0859213.1 sigma-70 family RNA polymerase sigma factor [Alphaproteobacteria bacterium]